MTEMDPLSEMYVSNILETMDNICIKVAELLKKLTTFCGT
jgi:hypothetical protein